MKLRLEYQIRRYKKKFRKFNLVAQQDYLNILSLLFIVLHVVYVKAIDLKFKSDKIIYRAFIALYKHTFYQLQSRC